MQPLMILLWVQVMKYELYAFDTNNTWDLVLLPPGNNLLFVNGFTRSNSNLMVLLNATKPGWLPRGIIRNMAFDYHETFSPVIKMSTIRFILLLLPRKNGLCFNWM